MLTMVSIRSNLNSVSNAFRPAAIKSHWNTCLQNWRSKTISIKFRNHLENCQSFQVSHKYKESSFKEKTNEHFKDYLRKLQKLFAKLKKKTIPSRYRGEGLERQEQIFQVSKLFATSLIASSQLSDTQNQKDFEEGSFWKIQKSFYQHYKMTIVEDTVLTIKDEYPDLEMELRSILMARTQEGATISEIREDYMKNTGMPLPLYENVTDFLLSIPSVSAICNDNGTLIFNIQPSAKNKHIHDLVLNQKPQINSKRPLEEERPYGCLFWRNNLNYKKQKLQQLNFNQLPTYNESHFYYEKPNTKPNVNHKSNHINKENVLPFGEVGENPRNFENALQNEKRIPFRENSERILQPLQNEGEVRSNILSKMAMAFNEKELTKNLNNENNWFYQDNVNYLQNRLYNNEVVPPPPPYYHLNDINTNTNSNNCFPLNAELHSRYLNTFYQNQHQQDQQQQRQDLFRKTLNISKNYLQRNWRAPTPFRVQPFRSRRLTSSPVYSKSIPTNDSYQTTESDFDAHFLDFPLMGDDFFLYLARMELKCKFKKNHGVYQSGFCVSGQTIGDAIDMIKQLPYRLGKRIIVNIGSVDIMQGSALIKIQHDFKKLLSVLKEKDLHPILTTLAPLANYIHEPEIKQKVERFNEFIKKYQSKYTVIDVFSILVSDKGHTLFGCFQNEPRWVTGAPEPYVFWNKIGRQRVLKLIESKLEY